MNGATSYEIQWKKPGDTSFILWTDTISGTSANFIELEPGMQYQFQVRAVNINGESAWSSIHSVTTANANDVPLAIPTNIALNARTTTTLSISWTGDANAEGYTIQWSSTENFATILSSRNSNATTYKITGLDADTEYWVRIIATTTADGYLDSHASIPVKFTTAEETTTSTFDPVVTPDSNTTVISWTEGTQPEGGVLQFKVSSSSEWITWKGELSEQSIAIAGLKADTTYDFRFLDADGKQVGEVIQTTTGQATADIPGSTPVKPKVAVVKKGESKPTISSVTLTWNALPKKATTESNVVYIITCTTPNSGITPIAITGTDKLSHIFTGLKPNTTYKFTITAVNADGESVNAKGKTVAVKITAKTAKYAAVSKVKGSLSGDGIALSWQVPSNPANGAEYTAYQIEWIISKTERKSVTIASVASDGKSATVLLQTLEDLGVDMTSTSKCNFVIRAVIYAEDGATVVNQSLDCKFSITPAKLV